MHPDHPDADRAENFAGIPDLAKALATGDSSLLGKKARPYEEFTLPEKYVSEDFRDNGFTDEDLTFRMMDLRPSEQEAAAELGGEKASAISREMLFASLMQIGSWDPRKNRDRLEQWWASLGPRCTGLVQAAFVKTQSVEQEDVEAFLASSKRGRA